MTKIKNYNGCGKGFLTVNNEAIYIKEFFISIEDAKKETKRVRDCATVQRKLQEMRYAEKNRAYVEAKKKAGDNAVYGMFFCNEFVPLTNRK